MHVRRAALLALPITLGGCAAQKQLREDVSLLQYQVAVLNTEVAALKGATEGPSQSDEEAARELLSRYNERMEAFDVEEARAAMEELMSDYADTSTAQRAQRYWKEFQVIGQPAPEIVVDQWFIAPEGEPYGELTILVFWEEWCPHCRREVPSLEERYAALGPQGLQVLALTKLTRSTTEEEARAFIEEHELSFPVGQENGALSETFAISGIPAAAIVEDGIITWRGHPARIDWDQIAERLQ